MKKLLLIFFVCIFAVSGCKDDDDDELPATHTVNKGGSMHAPGLLQASTNCISCHGATLQGGGEAPSCYSCHGKKWE